MYAIIVIFPNQLLRIKTKEIEIHLLRAKIYPIIN